MKAPTKSKRKPARKVVGFPTDASKELLRTAAAISAGVAAVSWETRVLVAIMLMNENWDEAEARTALQPTLDFYGRAAYPEEHGQHFALPGARRRASKSLASIARGRLGCTLSSPRREAPSVCCSEVGHELDGSHHQSTGRLTAVAVL